MIISQPNHDEATVMLNTGMEFKLESKENDMEVVITVDGEPIAKISWLYKFITDQDGDAMGPERLITLYDDDKDRVLCTSFLWPKNHRLGRDGIRTRFSHGAYIEWGEDGEAELLPYDTTIVYPKDGEFTASPKPQDPPQ